MSYIRVIDVENRLNKLSEEINDHVCMTELINYDIKLSAILSEIEKLIDDYKFDSIVLSKIVTMLRMADAQALRVRNLIREKKEQAGGVEKGDISVMAFVLDELESKVSENSTATELEQYDAYLLDFYKAWESTLFEDNEASQNVRLILNKITSLSKKIEELKQVKLGSNSMLGGEE